MAQAVNRWSVTDEDRVFFPRLLYVIFVVD